MTRRKFLKWFCGVTAAALLPISEAVAGGLSNYPRLQDKPLAKQIYVGFPGSSDMNDGLTHKTSKATIKCALECVQEYGALFICASHAEGYFDNAMSSPICLESVSVISDPSGY